MIRMDKNGGVTFLESGGVSLTYNLTHTVKVRGSQVIRPPDSFSCICEIRGVYALKVGHPRMRVDIHNFKVFVAVGRKTGHIRLTRFQ
jgi:hypothetical protein